MIEYIQTGDADSPIQNITIAIGLQQTVGMQQMNLVNLRHIFEVKAFITDRSFNPRFLTIRPCTRQMWSMINDKKYQTLRLHTHMCIDRQSIKIYGENGSPDVNVLYFSISACNPTTSPIPCADSTTIDTFLSTQKLWGRYFACSLAVLNIGLNPTNENPIQYQVYEKTLWLLFNQQQQILTQLFFGTFEINTDTNFLPFQSKEQKTGYFVNQAVVSTIVKSPTNTLFIQCYAFVSPVHKVINRTYGKFDEVLSYVGGLYGIVISFFAFFLMSFNQYKYELRVSEGAFSFRDAHLAKESDFHFLKFLKYAAYDWIKTLFCCEPDWPDCQAIDQSRQQANEQIDVKHLLKRISHLQKIITLFVNIKDQTVLYLAQSNSIEDARKRRNIVNYCEKLSQADKNTTISTYELTNALFFLGQDKKILKSQQSAIFPLQQNISLNPTFISQLQSQNQQFDSINLMKKYVWKYNNGLSIQNNSIVLSQEQKKIEQQIAQSFYNLDQQIRIKIIKKIPLCILSRLYTYYQQFKNSINNQKVDQNIFKDQQKQNGKDLQFDRSSQFISRHYIRKETKKHKKKNAKVSNSNTFQSSIQQIH